MSWPIGTISASAAAAIAADGAIVLGGVRVTDADGWLDVAVHPQGHGQHSVRSTLMHVRLRVELSDGGLPFVYANEVVTGGRRFASVLAAIAAGCDSWASVLPASVLQELSDRYRRLSRTQSAVHRIVPHFEERREEAPTTSRRRA